MKEEDKICPYCNSKPEETDDYHASRDIYGMMIDLWCPNCGAIAEWSDRYPWPSKKEWKIGKIALEVLERNLL